MKYLNIDTKDLELKGAYYTAKEISSQPEMWRKTYERVREERDQIKQFLDGVCGTRQSMRNIDRSRNVCFYW